MLLLTVRLPSFPKEFYKIKKWTTEKEMSCKGSEGNSECKSWQCNYVLRTPENQNFEECKIKRGP